MSIVRCCAAVKPPLAVAASTTVPASTTTVAGTTTIHLAGADGLAVQLPSPGTYLLSVSACIDIAYNNTQALSGTLTVTAVDVANVVLGTTEITTSYPPSSAGFSVPVMAVLECGTAPGIVTVNATLALAGTVAAQTVTLHGTVNALAVRAT